MPPFSNSSTTGFRMPPLEDLSQDQDPHAASCSFYRVFAELGFVASVIAGICIQQHGIIHQTNTAADIVKIVVFAAGAWTCGENMGCLYNDIFAPKHPNLAPPPQPRRRRRRLPAQRQESV